jgi:protein-disulfide isomerase
MKAGAIAAMLMLALAGCEPPRALETYSTVPITPFLGEAIMGDPQATVTLVEYASTTCAHCRAFHKQAFARLRSGYIDTGKVKLQFVMMPTQPVGVALAGEALARCAGEDRYFEVIDTLFDAQDTLTSAARAPWLLQQELFSIGEIYGLTKDEVGSCLDNRDIVALTGEAVKAAPADITGTPSFAINGVKLTVNRFDDLFDELDRAVAASRAPQPAGEPPKKPY